MQRKTAKRTATRSKKLAILPPVGALKLRDAASYLGGLSIPTMRRLVQRGVLRPNRMIRHYLVSVEELDRFLREGLTDES